MTVLSEFSLSHLGQIQNVVDEEVQNFGAGRLDRAAFFVLADDTVQLVSN